MKLTELIHQLQASCASMGDHECVVLKLSDTTCCVAGVAHQRCFLPIDEWRRIYAGTVPQS